MPAQPTLYDLVLLLSTESDEDTRAKVLAEVQSAIADGGGEIAREQQWGRRPTSFEIAHQGEAEYHLLQFTGPPSLLEALSHNLRIADQVLRFRIIKVRPGTPELSEQAPPVMAGATVGAGEAEPASE
jgi:small subunit ribosomal protein S6